MKFKINKNSLINFMIMCIPLYAYKVITIAEKDLSLIYVIWALICLYGFIDLKMLGNSIRKKWFVFIAIAYFIFNSIILNNYNNWGAIFQFIVLWTMLIVSYRRVSIEQFSKTIIIFQNVMNILAIYGIYEFVGRLFHLPFSDLWIEGLMVKGYNWYNSINIGGLTVYRANGLFMEPSLFAQFLAINILLYIFADSTYNKRHIGKIIINFIAFFCTFSGTGILLLVVASFILTFSKNGYKELKKIIRKYKIWIFMAIIFIPLLFFSPVGKHLISRLTEFDPTNTSSISGYIRFNGQFNIATAAWKTNPYYGLGIGNVQDFIDIYRMSGSATSSASIACSMIVARYAAELGLVGLILLIFLYKSFFSKSKLNIWNYKVFLFAIILMTPLNDTGISVYYWMLIYIINVDFFKEPDERRNIVAR